jgi:Anion-transporting ATPase
MDFVIATIPTVMALEESARLARALKEEGVPASTIIVNQIVGEGMGEKYVKMKLQEQRKAMDMLAASPHLKGLEVIKGKLMDLEVRGMPALQYFATTLWHGMPTPPGGTGEGLVRKGEALSCLLCMFICHKQLCKCAILSSSSCANSVCLLPRICCTPCLYALCWPIARW